MDELATRSPEPRRSKFLLRWAALITSSAVLLGCDAQTSSATAPEGSVTPKEATDGWPRAPQAANSGTFAVVQFATANPEAVVAAWAEPTPGVKVHATHEAKMGQPLTNFVNFRNCKGDAKGLCNVTTEWQVIGPKGDVTVTTRSNVRVGLPALRPGTVGLSTDGVGVTFEPPDAPGLYLVRARTTDHVAGITLQTEDAITVQP